MNRPSQVRALRPGPPASPLRPALLLAGTLLALQILQCHGHGFMVTPLSRARLLNYGEYEASAGNGLGAQPFRKNPDGSLLNDQADACGDPHQDIGDIRLRNQVTAIQATYSPGSVISITFRARVNHGGWIGYRICPTARVNPSQACFDAYPLVNADTGYNRWWLQTGQYGTQTDYTTKWKLPSGVSCDGGCVLQMTYRTANSCVDSCSAAECGPAYSVRNNPVTRQSNLPSCGRTEIFRDCADIRITGSSTARPPPPPGTTARPPPPPSSTNLPPPPTGGGGGTCGQTAQQFCSGRSQGMYGDRCVACAKFFWCTASGSYYMACAAGTAMNPNGGQGCDFARNIVCPAP